MQAGGTAAILANIAIPLQSYRPDDMPFVRRQALAVEGPNSTFPTFDIFGCDAEQRLDRGFHEPPLVSINLGYRAHAPSAGGAMQPRMQEEQPEGGVFGRR
jgi:hypothetical protein